MARIRVLEINNFRGIKKLVWHPAPGINCLIGPGDSGKSSILDAIDFCLGARRNIQFTDADFHRLDVETPITISMTIGVGSTRLLIAGLQRKAAAQATIILIDELEHGLEPHRIIRLLGSLGAKENDQPLQAFMTTHSPVALRELSGNQLFIVKPNEDNHEILSVGITNEIQSTIRLFPDAFLAQSVLVGEGASEVGFVRGLDQHRVANGRDSISARGTCLVDCGGGGPDKPFERAAVFQNLGYRTAIVRDSDNEATLTVGLDFELAGGEIFSWRDTRTLEDELFLSLTDNAVEQLIGRAIMLHGERLVDEHIKSASQNAVNLNSIANEMLDAGISVTTREFIGKAARTKRAGWFKSVTWMEDAARDIVGPDLADSDAGFRIIVERLFTWANNAP